MEQQQADVMAGTRQRVEELRATHAQVQSRRRDLEDQAAEARSEETRLEGAIREYEWQIQIHDSQMQQIMRQPPEAETRQQRRARARAERAASPGEPSEDGQRAATKKGKNARPLRVVEEAGASPDAEEPTGS